MTNSGTLSGVYDLADTLTFNGATVNAITAPAYASLDRRRAGRHARARSPAPAGGTIVTGETVTAGGAETWTYTVTYTVTDPAAAQDCVDPSMAACATGPSSAAR